MVLLQAGLLDFSQMQLIHVETPAWYCSHGNCSGTALLGCSTSELDKVSSLRLVFLLSSDDPVPWDPRVRVAMEPSLCPSTLQDLAKAGALEPEATPFQSGDASKEAPNNLFNTSNLSRLGGTQFSILDGFCKKSGNCKQISLIFFPPS